MHPEHIRRNQANPERSGDPIRTLFRQIKKLEYDSNFNFVGMVIVTTALEALRTYPIHGTGPLLLQANGTLWL